MLVGNERQSRLLNQAYEEASRMLARAEQTLQAAWNILIEGNSGTGALRSVTQQLKAEIRTLSYQHNILFIRYLLSQLSSSGHLFVLLLVFLRFWTERDIKIRGVNFLEAAGVMRPEPRPRPTATR